MKNKDVIQLSDHFTLPRLMRFCLPSIVMMVFTSIYGVVDGYFVSNFVGKTAFASVNLVMPFLMILGGVGFMIGTGGSALVAKCLGEKNEEQARRVFSMMIYLTFILGVTLSGPGAPADHLRPRGAGGNLARPAHPGRAAAVSGQGCAAGHRPHRPDHPLLRLACGGAAYAFPHPAPGAQPGLPARPAPGGPL